MSGIFLSYRRDDASGWAGRLYEHLVREWGHDQVFMDIDAIAPGEDFREAIARTMATCDVVLVVIGPSWLNVRDEAAHRRLDDEADVHRAEVVAALEAQARVIPILVGDADMPRPADLPDPLKNLAYRNAWIIEDRRWATDVATLLDTLRRYVGGTAQPTVEARSLATPALPASPATDAAPAGSMAFGAAAVSWPLILAGIGAVMVVVWGVVTPRDWHDEYGATRIIASLALVGVTAVGLWLGERRLVLLGCAVGTVGLALWMQQLTSTHTEETGELFGFAYDGTPNVLTFVGLALVLAGSLIASAAPKHAPPRN